jgi:hypothetical protein
MNTKRSTLSITIWLSTLTILLLSGCKAVPEKQLDVDDELMIEIEDNTAYLSGILGDSLVEQLSDLVKENPNVTDFVLVDIPGAVNQQATMEGAGLIRRLGINTHIAATGFVLSGGVDLFLGGVERTIGAGAGVGIHAWTDGTKIKAANVNVADPVHAEYVNFYLRMGIPERFYWFSLEAAPADRVYFLSPEEMYDFELVTK